MTACPVTKLTIPLANRSRSPVLKDGKSDWPHGQTTGCAKRVITAIWHLGGFKGWMAWVLGLRKPKKKGRFMWELFTGRIPEILPTVCFCSTAKRRPGPESEGKRTEKHKL